jgi:hypothetical protein
MIRIIFTSVLAAIFLSACSPKYACDAPEGIGCMSLGEVYERDKNGAPMRRAEGKDEKSEKESASETIGDKSSFVAKLNDYRKPVTAGPGQPIFREPRRLRLWIVDWENEDGTVYVPNHYVHIRLDNGEWVLPEIRLRTLEEFRSAQ